MDRAPRAVLCVTGSIAAFKGVQLASDMIKAGIEVRPLLTRGGARFVTPLTLGAITGSPPSIEIWDDEEGGSQIGHIELARWADVLVVAPASAGALARLALGLADDMLGAVALARSGPLVIAPAMETGMWEHPATQAHIATLRDRGARIVGPVAGRLASGSSGLGRMSEPDEVLHEVRRILSSARGWEGRKIIVTAGPTYEAIDSVRFLGNRSSGKMGYAVAEEAISRGASVRLITGPVSIPAPQGTDVVRVESGAEMKEAVIASLPGADVLVMAAAVSDFRPAHRAEGKIRRHEALRLDLEPTEDIAGAAATASPSTVHVGFALEADNLIESARAKLHRKGVDLVVANAVDATHNPFGSDVNRVALVSEDGVQELPLMSKRDVAAALCDAIDRLMVTRRTD